MAKAPKAVVEQEAGASAPVSVPEYSEAQLYKLNAVKAKAEAEVAKREEVLKKLRGTDFKPGIRGTWLNYTEKSGAESPAMVIAERFTGEGEELKVILTLYVFSPSTAQPYKAELVY